MPSIPHKSADKQQLSSCKWINDGLVRMLMDSLGFQDGRGLQIRVQEFDSPTRLHLKSSTWLSFVIARYARFTGPFTVLFTMRPFWLVPTSLAQRQFRLGKREHNAQLRLPRYELTSPCGWRFRKG
jgi:hypothetical protein